MELGSAGIMRGYMAHPCSEDFPLEEKLDAFFRLSLGGYGVPAEEIERVVQKIRSLDIRAIAQGASCSSSSTRWKCATPLLSAHPRPAFKVHRIL